MKMEQTECSETSVCKIQMPGNYPEENIQHSEHGESLKPRMFITTIIGAAPVVKANTFNFVFIYE
jgi:hypothetical protein